MIRSSSVDSGRYSDYESNQRSKDNSDKGGKSRKSKKRYDSPTSDSEENVKLGLLAKLAPDTSSKTTPREVAGIPLSLPWNHMTKAEKRRLMFARIETETAL